MSRMFCGSFVTSKTSVASVCILNASSNDWMRASSTASRFKLLGVHFVHLLEQIELLALLRRASRSGS